MQTIERTPEAYLFTGEAIGRTLAEALAFSCELGAGDGELVEVWASGRPILRGTLADMAALAG